MTNSRVIVPVSVKIVERKGHEILVVEDGNGQEYSTADSYLVNKFKAEEEKWKDREGDTWEIAYERTEKGYLDFKGFLSPLTKDEPDSMEARIEQLEKVVASIETSLQNLDGIDIDYSDVVEENPA